MGVDKDAKIFVAGHRGLVGAAVVRALKKDGYNNLVMKTHKELDLTRQAAVEEFFDTEKPAYVILAAAKVGGIHANSTYPAEFIAVNLQIQTNVIDAAYKSGVKKLLFLGSSCIYPKFAQAYRLQYNFDAISGMPTNLYGPHDNFHPENSHVLPALIRRFHEAKVNGAKEVVVWGSGSPFREFLHVDDLAEATVFLLQNYSAHEHVNMGSGSEVSIKELAEMVKEVVGFQGQLTWDTSKPDGTPRKLIDSSKLANMGWQARIPLKEGLAETYKWYCENYNV